MKERVKIGPRSLLIRLLPIVLLCTLFPSPNMLEARAIPRKTKILLLHSYHHGYKWTDDITQGVRNAVSQYEKPVELYIEYMDTKRLASQEHMDRLLALYAVKYKANDFKVIITADDNAFNLMRSHGRQLFPGKPVVFCGVNFFQDSDLEGLSGFTGVNEEIDLKAGLDLIHKLHPNAPRIAVIYDDTTTGQKVHKQLLSVLPLYTDKLKFVFPERSEMESIQETVSTLPPGSVVFYTIFLRDNKDNFYEYDDSIRLIAEHFNGPIYGTWDFSLNAGIVGGMLTSGYYQGTTAGQLTVRILEGESPDKIPVVKKSPNRYMFDRKQLERYRIPFTKLPPDSIIVNQPFSFYKNHGNIIWGGLLLLTIIFITILGLILNITRRKQAERNLKIAGDELEERVRERTRELAAANLQLQKEMEVRSRAQQETREFHERFSKAFEHNPTAMALSTYGEGRFMEVNNSFLSTFGFSQREVIGNTSTDLGLFSMEMRTQMLQAVENKGYVRNIETQLKDKNGNTLDILLSVEPITVDNNKVLLSAFVDLTDRKLTEETLRQSEAQFRQMAENIQDGLTILEDGHISYMNKRIFEITGYDIRYFVRMRTLDFVAPQDRLKMLKALAKFKKDGTIPEKNEVEIIRKDGSRCHILNRYSRKKEADDKNSVYIITTDITEQKMLDKALLDSKEKTEAVNRKLQKAIRHANKMTEQAQEANLSKSQFLANMSHEIRTPLNGVIGFSEMLLNTNLEAEQIEYVNAIIHSGDALLSLINDILDFSKIEAGLLELETVPFCPEQIAFDVCESIQPWVGSKPIEVLCRIDDNVPQQVMGDPMRFRQVLLNLMGNAPKFTQKGEIEIALKVDKTDPEGVYLHTSIRDTGIGIPSEKLSSIFKAFQQADGSITRKYGGTGLGLTISKQVATLMNGEVWAESVVGQGSTFHFTAWFANADESKPQPLPRFTNTPPYRCLLLTENLTHREILAHFLETQGLEVESIFNCETLPDILKQAIKQNKPFHIGICDTRVSKLELCTLVKMIRRSNESFANIPMIALSTLTDLDTKRFKDMGYNGFLSKPVRKQKLLELMERLLAGDPAAQSSLSPPPGFQASRYLMGETEKRKARILVVEDNSLNRKLIQRMLDKVGVESEILKNGLEAVQCIEKDPNAFDLVFMDIQMPVMDGETATRTIREKGFIDIPIVALTANAIKGDREKYLEAGMNDYITKPLKKEFIHNMLDKWLKTE